MPDRMRIRAWLFWSSGKDSAYALYVLRAAGQVEVVGLVTTVEGDPARVAMHGTPLALVQRQADAVGLPLRVVALPWPCPNESYEAAMAEVCAAALREEVAVVAFGDLFLSDIRAYREGQLVGTGLTAMFPLWGRDTTELAREMLAVGQRATVVCVDASKLDAGDAGREVDAHFLDSLPVGVDPCGENGEFHTFATDGPAFLRPVPVKALGAVARDGFVVAELSAADAVV